jgi:hypothetical protein
MAIWGWAHLPAAVSLPLLEALFMQISGLVYLEFSGAWLPLLQALPFPSTLGEVTLHQLSQACVFYYSSHGTWVFSPLLWSFSPTSTFRSFPTPDCWACAATPAFSGWLVYLQLTWEVGLPPSPVEFSSPCHFYKLSCSWLLGVCHCCCLLQPACEGFPLRTPCPLCFVCFLLLLLIIKFFFLFPWVGVGLSRGLCWSGPGLSVGVLCAA